MTTPVVAERSESEAVRRSRVGAIEWLRRVLASNGHPAGAVLGEVLVEIGTASNAARMLEHPWTEEWLTTAVCLVDRDALKLLPGGQMTAHLGRAVNLLAALKLGREPVTVRFDEHGAAWLPGTGAIARAPIERAGRSAQFSAASEDGKRGDGAGVRWPEAVVCQELNPGGQTPAILVDEPAWVGGGPTDRSEPDVHSGPDDAGLAVARTPLSADARSLIERWRTDGGVTRSVPSGDESASPSTAIVEHLGALGIPVSTEPNRLGADHIRQDASFDHLSLLSVREPTAFAALEQIAGEGTDVLSRRVRGHVAYIRRRYLDSAAIYAELLVGRPGDTDTWRDLCWALRHAGREEEVRVRVLHPHEVVQVAEAVGWATPTSWPAGAGRGVSDPLDLIVDLLEWIAHDLRRR